MLEGAVGGTLFAGLGSVGGMLADSSRFGAVARSSFSQITSATSAQVGQATGRFAAKVVVTAAGYAAVTSATNTAGQGIRMVKHEQEGFNWIQRWRPRRSAALAWAWGWAQRWANALASSER